MCPIGHTFGHKNDAGDAFGRIDVDSDVRISLGKVSRSHRTDRRLLDIHPNTTRRRISFMFIGAKGCRMRGVVRLWWRIGDVLVQMMEDCGARWAVMEDDGGSEERRS